MTLKSLKSCFSNSGKLFLEQNRKAVISKIKSYIKEAAKKTKIPNVPEAIPLTNKMWILPDATVQPLSQWHWSWLQTHPLVYKKFKIKGDPQKMDEGMGRKRALQAGFFRVAYELNRGQLTIEGCEKFFTKKIKDAIFMLVLDNVDAVDNMTVNLFDDEVKKLVWRGSEPLFHYSGQEKLNKLPLRESECQSFALKYILNRGFRPFVKVNEKI